MAHQLVISTTSQLCSHLEQQSADTLAEDGVSREEVSRDRKCFVMWGRKYSLAGHHKLCFIKQKLKLVAKESTYFEDYRIAGKFGGNYIWRFGL